MVERMPEVKVMSMRKSASRASRIRPSRLKATRLISARPMAPAVVADLERYLDVTRGEVLFARGVLLVEGEAERFLLPALAKAEGVDFDFAEIVGLGDIAELDEGHWR